MAASFGAAPSFIRSQGGSDGELDCDQAEAGKGCHGIRRRASRVLTQDH